MAKLLDRFQYLLYRLGASGMDVPRRKKNNQIYPNVVVKKVVPFFDEYSL